MGSKRRRAAADEAAHSPANATAKKQKQSQSAATAAAVSANAAKPAAHASPVKPTALTVAADAAPAAKKKKQKKKAKSTGADAPAATKPVTSTAAKRNGSEIDDLFASLKTKKREQVEAEEQQQRAAKKALAKERQAKKLLDEQIKLLEAQNTNSTATTGANPEARPVRYDEDGLPIYTEESLKINQGGDTADCPFDCWCCF